MEHAEIPANDAERLASLASFHILDSAPEEACDRITSLAALLAGVPMAAINFVDRERQWFKSSIGLGEGRETPRATGFCAHAILSPEIMVVTDASRDRRFRDNPFVAGAPGIRYYLGVPLVDQAGLCIGTLCVLDSRPRRLSRRCTEALRQLAALLMAQLRQRRQLLSTIAEVADVLDQSPDEVYLLAPEENRIWYANRRALSRLGYSQRELDARPLAEVFAACGVASPAANDCAPAGGGSAHRATEHIARGGERYPVACRERNLRFGGIDMQLVIARELGEQRAMESRLAREREFSQGLLENLSEGVVACDGDGRLSVVNRTLREWIPDLNASTSVDCWPGQLSLREGDELAPLADDRVPLSRALRGERVRGARLIIAVPGMVPRHVLVNADPLCDETGSNRGAVSVLSDVTSQYYAEMQLRQAREQYRILIESSPDMVLVHRDGVIAYINWTGVQVLGGKDPREFVGRPIIDLLHPDFHDVARQRVREMHATGRVAKPLEEIFFRLDGSMVPLEVAATPISHNGMAAIQVVARDVSERHRTTAALREAEMRFRSLFENAAEGIFQITPQGDFITANPAMARLLGLEDVQALCTAANPRSFAYYLSHEVLRDLLARVEREGDVVGHEVEVVKENPERAWLSVNLRAVRSASGELHHYEGSALDVTEVKRHQRTLEYQATHDLLTQLPNRNLLDDRLLQALAMSSRRRRQVAVAFIDLDNFKDINDTFGHRIGDAVLSEAARRLVTTVRAVDTVARVGGDEFVVVAGDQQTFDETSILMRRLLAALSLPIPAGDTLVEVTCSIGVSLYPDDAQDAETLLRYADMAMYRAKQQGRNFLQYFTQSINSEVQARVLLERALRNALPQREFHLVYQPQVDLAAGRVTKCEALLRWTSARLGPRSPAEFIGVAEETSMILRIGEWVIGEACAQLGEWHARGFTDLGISINLSPRQLRDRDLLPMIESTIRRHNLRPQCLEFELTETMLINGTDEVKVLLGRLRDAGVRLSIDDFGTGYSSLSYLREFPIDGIKIDKSFIVDIDDHPGDELIVKTMIALAMGLKLNVVAEGVETCEQLNFLRAQEVRVMQGFLFSKPLPAPEMMDYLVRNYAAGAISPAPVERAIAAD